MFFLLLEGVCVCLFARMEELWSSILVMTIFSIFVQAAEGSTYGIAPYVNRHSVGSVAGIVGAGGPLGAVVFGLGFLLLDNTTHVHNFMGVFVMVAGVATLGMNIRGEGGILMHLSAKDQWRQSVLTLQVNIEGLEADCTVGSGPNEQQLHRIDQD